MDTDMNPQSRCPDPGGAAWRAAWDDASPWAEGKWAMTEPDRGLVNRLFSCADRGADGFPPTLAKGGPGWVPRGELRSRCRALLTGRRRPSPASPLQRGETSRPGIGRDTQA